MAVYASEIRPSPDISLGFKNSERKDAAICKSVAVHCSCLNGPRQMEPLGHDGLLMHMASTAQEGAPHPGTEDKAAGHAHSSAVSRGGGA